MVSDKGLKKYRALCDQLGIHLTDEQVLEHAIALFRAVKCTYVQMTEEEREVLQQRRKETGDLKE